MSTSGGLNCKKHGDYHVECKDCIIEELQAKVNRQASSHGLYITQTLEPKIYELETEISRLTKMVIEYRIVYEDNCHTNGTIMFENEKLKETLELALNALKWPSETGSQNRQAIDVIENVLYGPKTE